jgi:hypothetical protein
MQYNSLVPNDIQTTLFGLKTFTTVKSILCQYCNTEHNKDKDSSSQVRFTVFADKVICHCCFNRIEDGVLSRIPDIVAWFTDMIKKYPEKSHEKRAKALHNMYLLCESVSQMVQGKEVKENNSNFPIDLGKKI